MNIHGQKKHGWPIKTNVFTNIYMSFSKLIQLHYEEKWTRWIIARCESDFRFFPLYVSKQRDLFWIRAVLRETFENRHWTLKWWTWTQYDSGRMLVWFFVSKSKRVENATTHIDWIHSHVLKNTEFSCNVHFSRSFADKGFKNIER